MPAPAVIPRLKNSLRHLLRRGLLGGLVQAVAGGPHPTRIRVVSATRKKKQEFWRSTALGRSLRAWRQDHRLDIDVAFENRLGLPLIYNAALRAAQPSQALLFVHDDVWLDDPLWIDKVLVGLRRFDVIGLAGNTRRLPGQQAWHFHRAGPGVRLDFPHLSGAVAHGEQARGVVSQFGPVPLECELLDGVFLATRKDVCVASEVAFDERFDFHFYDLDFCRTARTRGLKLGTWLIAVTHQSTGEFDSPAWKEGLRRYQAKWKH